MVILLELDLTFKTHIQLWAMHSALCKPRDTGLGSAPVL